MKDINNSTLKSVNNQRKISHFFDLLLICLIFFFLRIFIISLLLFYYSLDILSYVSLFILPFFKIHQGIFKNTYNIGTNLSIKRFIESVSV